MSSFSKAFSYIALLGTLFLTGCGADWDDDDDLASEEAESGQVSQAQTATTTETVEIRDPVENCFTVKVPKGWQNAAYSSRSYDIHREVVNCVSPNNDTVLFLGDPKIPQYWDPKQAHAVTYQFAKVNPMMEIEAFQPADQFFPEYVKKKFGKLDGFAMGAVEQSEVVTNELHQAFAKHGLQAKGFAVTVDFTYEENGQPRSAMVVGATIDCGAFWIADVWGISTAGKAEDYFDMLLAMARSKKTNPEWTAKQNQLHEERMAQMRAHQEMMNARHAQNMSWIQRSAQAHQQRMQAIWAANDASMQSYWERSAASDVSHRRFLNYINDESTVVDSSGQTRQVDNSYQRYFVNKNDNSYLGGDIRFDADAIRRMGKNPDDYEEVKVRN